MAEKMTLEEQARDLLALEYEVSAGEGPYLTYAKLARSGRGDFTMCSVRAVMRALERAHLTQPAQAVDVGVWRAEFDTLLEDYVTARVQAALHNVTQHSDGWIKMPRPRLQSLKAHIETLTRALGNAQAEGELKA